MLTYLPHKAVAEVSKDKEPIGRECAEFNCFESQLMSDSSEVRFKWCGLSSDLRFKWFWLSIDLRFKWFGCQSMWDSNDFGCLLFWTSSDVVVSWFEIQMIWMSNGLRFKWFGCQLMCDSNDFVKRSFSARFPSKLKLWSSKTKLFCETSLKIEALKLKNEAFLRDFLQNWSFEAQKQSFSARLPSKMQLWSSKTKLFCETSFKIEALKLKNEAFLRDFPQNWSFENQKRSFCARLPSKLKLWSLKTKLFCETSFKNATLKLQNEAFLQDFLQKCNFEAPKRSISARLPSKLKLWRSKTKHFCETSFKIEAVKLKNKAFLRDFLQKCNFEAPKRSISARLPSKLKLWSS